MEFLKRNFKEITFAIKKEVQIKQKEKKQKEMKRKKKTKDRLQKCLIN